MFSTQNIRRTFEDFRPLLETKETPDSLLLLVHLPGFTKEHVGATYEAAYKRVRISGERPLENNKWERFNVEYQVPETCSGEGLSGKFQEGAIVIISMPKKPIPTVDPKEEPRAAQEAAKQVTAPKPPSEVEADEAIEKDRKGISQEQPKSEVESQRESDEKKAEPSTPPKATGEPEMPQKDQEGIPPKGTADEEKDRDEIKERKETPTPQKDQEGIPQEGTLDDEKHEEKLRDEKKETTREDNGMTSEAGKAPQHEEKQRDEKKETTKEDNGKTCEAGKASQKDRPLAGKESKEERKEPAMVAAKSSGLRTAEREKKEMESKSGKVDEKTVSESPIVKGIKDVANSASQTVTRLARRFNEEDKQKLIYAGAAILAVAIGVYASFKIRSMARP